MTHLPRVQREAPTNGMAVQSWPTIPKGAVTSNGPTHPPQLSGSFATSTHSDPPTPDHRGQALYPLKQVVERFLVTTVPTGPPGAVAGQVLPDIVHVVVWLPANLQAEEEVDPAGEFSVSPVHLVQAVFPVPDDQKPSQQVQQRLAPVTSTNVPAGQGVQVVAELDVTGAPLAEPV